MALILSWGFLHVRAGVAGKEQLIVCLLASVSGPEPAVSKLNPGCVARPLRRVISPSHLLTAGFTGRNFTDFLTQHCQHMCRPTPLPSPSSFSYVFLSKLSCLSYLLFFFSAASLPLLSLLPFSLFSPFPPGSWVSVKLCQNTQSQKTGFSDCATSPCSRQSFLSVLALCVLPFPITTASPVQ